jgi:hypothetical protein
MLHSLLTTKVRQPIASSLSCFPCFPRVLVLPIGASRELSSRSPFSRAVYLVQLLMDADAARSSILVIGFHHHSNQGTYDVFRDDLVTN